MTMKTATLTDAQWADIMQLVGRGESDLAEYVPHHASKDGYSPEEIDEIVRACPVMVNGESTERIECAGYGNVRNIDEARIRGGVLLVIGEGMCLKAPKIQKHTERLKVPGWDFVSKFAAKGKEKEEGQ